MCIHHTDQFDKFGADRGLQSWPIDRTKSKLAICLHAKATCCTCSRNLHDIDISRPKPQRKTLTIGPDLIVKVALTLRCLP